MMYVVDVLEVGKYSHRPLFSLPSTTYNYLIYNGLFAILGLIHSVWHPHLRISHSLCNLYIAPFCMATRFFKRSSLEHGTYIQNRARLAGARRLHLEFDSAQSRWTRVPIKGIILCRSASLLNFHSKFSVLVSSCLPGIVLCCWIFHVIYNWLIVFHPITSYLDVLLLFRCFVRSQLSKMSIYVETKNVSYV
jgi:hypothetical protein